MEEIVFYGRIFEFKGVERLVRAGLELLERRPDARFRFVFIGPDAHDSRVGGSYTAFLRDRIPQAWRARFEFAGHLDHDAVAKRLERALFAVFPNRFESFCYALHELRDARVPIIATDIPAFRAVLAHERDALLCDGTVRGLTAAMERLLDDAALRERLGDHPLEPRTAIEPIYARLSQPDAAPGAGEPLAVWTLVIVPQGAPATLLERTLASLPGGGDGDRVTIARETEGDGVRMLGRNLRLESRAGKPLAWGDTSTLDAIWLLMAGDVPDRDYLDDCRRALRRNSRLAFAGTWTRDARGELTPSPLDIAPEIYPWEEGDRLTRAVVRSTPGIPLVEYLEPRLERYGEIGQVWKAVTQWGPGCLLPQGRLRRSELDEPAFDPVALAFLIANDDDPERQRRLALWSSASPECAHGPAFRSSPCDRPR